MNLHKLEIYASTPQNKKQNVTSVQGTLSSVPFPQGRLYPDFYYHRLVSKGTIIKVHQESSVSFSAAVISSCLSCPESLPAKR